MLILTCRLRLRLAFSGSTSSTKSLFCDLKNVLNVRTLHVNVHMTLDISQKTATIRNGNLPFEIIVDVRVQEPLYDVRENEKYEYLANDPQNIVESRM